MSGFFDLILVFIFIVLPVISNLIRASQKRNQNRNKRRKPQAQAGQAPQQAPLQPQAQAPVVSRQQVESSQSSASADSAKSDFERRLAEARARVQQSMAEGNSGGQVAQPQVQQRQQPARAQAPQQTQTQTQRTQPTARQVVPQTQTAIPNARRQARPQQRSLEVLKPLGGKNAKAQSIESGSLEGQSLERPIRTQRRHTTLSQHQDNRKATSLLLGGLSKKSTTRHGRKSITDSDRLLTMDDKSIMRGLVWKQILDTPKSKKRIAGPSERQAIPSLDS